MQGAFEMTNFKGPNSRSIVSCGPTGAPEVAGLMSRRLQLEEAQGEGA